MALIVKMRCPWDGRHLFWSLDPKRFVTFCEDGTVVFEGGLTTLEEVTARLLVSAEKSGDAFWMT